jgi:ABC-2 type transport system permease protein
VKEVKELVRDPKILLGVILMPLLIFPVMGSAISVSQRSMMQAMISASFAAYIEDEGPATDTLLNYLYQNNVVIPIEAASLEDALVAFQDTNATTLLHIREGYSENVSRGTKGHLKLYANLKTMTIAETGSTDTVSGIIGRYSFDLSINKIQGMLEDLADPADPYAVRSPVSTSSASIIKGNVLEVAPSAIFSLIMSQSVMLPIMVMVMLMFAIWRP